MKKLSKKDLEKKLDKAFSKWIRARDKHICFTCGMRLEANKSQNGHLFSRSYKAIKFDEMNCHCQCYRCNVAMKGNLHEYIKNFKAKYGQDEYYRLDESKNDYAGRSIEWYEEKIKYYGGRDAD